MVIPKVESEHEEDEDVVPESLIENARKAEPTVSQKDKYLPENYDATQFNFKGPLMIHHRLNFTPVHELDADPPREPSADDHFEFDSAMNEAYEIGEGVEQFVDETKTNPSTEPLSNAINQSEPGQQDALKEAAAIREAQRASLRSRSSSRTLPRNRLRSGSRSPDRHTSSKQLSKSRLRSGSRSPDRRSNSMNKNKRQKQYTSFRRIFTKDHGISAVNADKTQSLTQLELPIQKTNIEKPLMTKLPPYRPYREVPTQSSLSLPIAPPITSSPPEREQAAKRTEQATKSTISKTLQTTAKSSSGTKSNDNLIEVVGAKPGRGGVQKCLRVLEWLRVSEIKIVAVECKTRNQHLYSFVVLCAIQLVVALASHDWSCSWKFRFCKVRFANGS
ncbi:unnamed protein product [Toxocara canis]|uniref:TPX2 domain-containing protein n=1 Tax=Toxocara canis TaxID=6265 RepID=A0A183V4Q0_TOXCA|nr:unnamed protein product [Toxocara canis]